MKAPYLMLLRKMKQKKQSRQKMQDLTRRRTCGEYIYQGRDSKTLKKLADSELQLEEEPIPITKNEAEAESSIELQIEKPVEEIVAETAGSNSEGSPWFEYKI